MRNSDIWTRQLRSATVAFVALQALFGLAVAPSPGAVVNTKLSAPIGPDEDVPDFKISPDGRWVVYRAGRRNTNPPTDPSDEAHNLFSVPIEGGTAIQLNGLLPADSTVKFDYAISTDSRQVVYRANQDERDKVELYSVPIEGPAAANVKLNKSLPPGGDVTGDSEYQPGFKISPDGNRVVYRANSDDATVFELYSVPIEGPAASGVKLNAPIQGSGGVRPNAYHISPNSRWVVYAARQDSAATELYCVPIDGPSSEVVKLNGLLVSNGTVQGNEIAISPDSRWVVYAGDQQVNQTFELYSVPIRGPAVAGKKLNGTFPAGGDVFGLIAVSPDSQWVTYLADQRTDDEFELFAAPIEGAPGGGVRISHDLPADHDVGFETLAFSSDGSRVVYQEWGNYGVPQGVYSTPIDGPPSAAVRLNKPLPGDGRMFLFQVAAAADRVVYMAEQDNESVVELYSVPIAGPSSDAIQISGFLGLAGDVTSFAISPDGHRVAYRADHAGLTGAGDSIFQLWLTTVDGSGSVRRLNGPLVDEGDVSFEFAFAPDNQRVVYIATQDSYGVYELYVSYDRPAAAEDWTLYE